MTTDILRVNGLTTRFFTNEGQINAVSDVDLTISRGEVVGIVGESGSGKSVTALSLMDLIEPPGEITAGSIEYRNPTLAEIVAEENPAAVNGEFVDLRSIAAKQWESLRGTAFSMIFQDPESSFNRSLTVGEQIAEAVEVQKRATAHGTNMYRRTADDEYKFQNLLLSPFMDSQRYVSESSTARAIELLEQVGIPDPAERADEHPHEYSGGMLQRAMIAQAIAGKPDLLIADEPTTALDVTIQAQVLQLLDELQTELDMSILLITHDLGVVARTCDRVGVMYAGEIVENGTLSDVFDDPVHPYTTGLLGSIPDLDNPAPGKLAPIPGNVPSLLDHEMPDGCTFADRCPKAMTDCLKEPPLFRVSGTHQTRCYLAEQAYDPQDALSSDDGKLTEVQNE